MNKYIALFIFVHNEQYIGLLSIHAETSLQTFLSMLS